jgi:solute carrier family 44 (choline transporter-like protein), member 2/4/5
MTKITPTKSKRIIRFLGYKQRTCTDRLCLIIFLVFLLTYVCIAVLTISQSNPTSLIQASDSFGHTCGEHVQQHRPYQLYFDLHKCLTDGALSLICPTKKLCVNSCPNYYSHYQSLHLQEITRMKTKSFLREQLVCMYDFDPMVDNRTIVQLVQQGLCAPYTIASKPFLGRCLPAIITDLLNSDTNQTSNTSVSINQVNQQIFGINHLSDVVRLIIADLARIQESLALFIVIACVLTLIYMFAIREFASFIVILTITLFLAILLVISAFCWYTILTGNDVVYQKSTVARIVDDFIQLRTIYIVFGCFTSSVFVLGVVLVCILYPRIRLSIILLDQAAQAMFAVLSTLICSPVIIVVFGLLTSFTVYIEMCLSTVGKPIFLTMINNQSIPCQPTQNMTECLFQHAYGYNDLIFRDTDPITRHVIEFLVDNQTTLKWANRFAYLWFGAFLFALAEIILAGVFANYYWSKGHMSTSFPLIYSFIIVVRYHLGSIAFGSLLIALLRYIRMIIEYINSKLAQITDNFLVAFLMRCFACLFWLFEKFLKFLNKNSYVLIASRGYSFCKATRKAFVYVISNCLRFIVLVHLTEWILFCGTVTICACNAYLFYHYLQWTEQLDYLVLRWTPIVAIVIITYVITSLFFSVYDMAIKTFFMCFLQDLDENDGSIERPYVMNDELLRFVHKTNAIEKK